MIRGCDRGMYLARVCRRTRVS